MVAALPEELVGPGAGAPHFARVDGGFRLLRARRPRRRVATTRGALRAAPCDPPSRCTVLHTKHRRFGESPASSYAPRVEAVSMRSIVAPTTMTTALTTRRRRAVCGSVSRSPLVPRVRATCPERRHTASTRPRRHTLRPARRTSCGERVARTPGTPLSAPACPLCGAQAWDLRPVEDAKDAPDTWRWALSRS